jgi:hypothetical protein
LNSGGLTPFVRGSKFEFRTFVKARETPAASLFEVAGWSL